MKSSHLVILVLIAVFLSSPLILNPSLHTRSDAIVHLGIINAVLRSGIPPGNPFLAGERLHYYWFYDAMVAGMVLITGFDGALLMALINGGGIFLLLLSVFLIVNIGSGEGELSRGTWPAVFLAGFGLNGWGWLLLLPGLLRHGPGFLKSSLGGGVWGFLPRIVITKWEGTMGFMAGKFLVAGSFGPGLALMALSLYLLLRYREKPSLGRGLLLLASALLSLYLNLLIGAIFVIAALAALVVDACRERGKARFGPLIPLVAIGLALPYVWIVLGGSSFSGGTLLRPPTLTGLRKLFTVLLPLLVMAGVTWRRKPDVSARLVRRTALAGFFFTALVYLFVFFTGHNEYKLPYLMAIYLSGLVGANIRSLGKKGRILVWVLTISILPTTGLALIAYTLDKSGPRPSSAELLIYRKVREILPSETVMMAEKKPYLGPMAGGRDAYLAQTAFLRGGLADRKVINRRRSRLGEFWRGDNRESIIREISKEVGRPLAVVAYSPIPAPGPGFRVLLSQENISLWVEEE